MSTAAPQTDSPRRRPRARSYELVVPRNEKIASMLIAAVIFVVMLVAALFIVWLSYQIIQPVKAVPVAIPRAKGGESEAFGNNDDLQPPGVEEVPELSAPTLEDTRQRLMDSLGAMSAELDNPNLDGQGVSGGQGLGGRGGDEGRGDGGDLDAIPRYQRWKISFLSGATLQSYAKQLDYFGIELAVFRSRSDELTYARGLSSAKPTVRTGSRKTEKRARFEWESGGRKEADRRLLAKAGIGIGPAERWMQYYPEAELVKMELAEQAYYKAAGKTLIEVRQTVFRVRKAGDGYEFFVVSQNYREAP